MSRLRLTALALVLVAALGATLFISLRTAPAVPTPRAQTAAPQMYSYLIDVAGWYEITPNERAVASPFDFSMDGARVLPNQIGRWKGEPYDLGGDVDRWFENPDLVLSHYYRDERGHALWFSAFGSRSRKSYVLFEHTPATSYPAAGWTLLKNSVSRIRVDAREIAVQDARLKMGNERRVALYWYLWNDFDRDPEKGVLTMRLHIPVVTSEEDSFEAGADFLRSIFPQVINWHRF